MKKKGFTLIELLAVIVILAIIALIAIPLIGNVIEKAKIGALENSVNGLVESANMYYANQSIKGEQATETIFDFANGEQTSTEKLEYKGKVYNGKLILHTNGEVAVCIDDKEHYAYKNKDNDEIVSGVGTCLYDGATGDFSSNGPVEDLRGKNLISTSIFEEGENVVITIPKEGHYDETSKISVPIETIKNNVNSLSTSSIIQTLTVDITSPSWETNGYSRFFTAPSDGVLVINTAIQVAAGANYVATGTMQYYIKKNDQYIVESVSRSWGPQTSPVTLVDASTQYNMQEGEIFEIYAKFTGTWRSGGNASTGFTTTTGTTIASTNPTITFVSIKEK